MSRDVVNFYILQDPFLFTTGACLGCKILIDSECLKVASHPPSEPNAWGWSVVFYVWILTPISKTDYELPTIHFCMWRFESCQHQMLNVVQYHCS